MNFYTVQTQNRETKEIVNEINKIRLENKNRWYQIKIVKPGDEVGLKIYNTWIQLSTKPLFKTTMDLKIKEFKQNLTNGIEKFKK